MRKLLYLMLILATVFSALTQEQEANVNATTTDEVKVDISDFDKVNNTEQAEEKTKEELEIEEWEKNIENFNPEHLYTVKVAKFANEVSFLIKIT